ncbi:hypothetical protein [Pseudophaeobacter arcticus]|uniref:hypothetical protein n=1 Tax=Pseudophaeobacter arcticus TaxID=385492 RepID=UPI003A96AC4F
MAIRVLQCFRRQPGLVCRLRIFLKPMHSFGDFELWRKNVSLTIILKALTGALGVGNLLLEIWHRRATKRINDAMRSLDHPTHPSKPADAKNELKDE